MFKTLRKIKRGLWQEEREIIRGLQQRPPVAAWREVMVMGLTAGLGHEWQPGWEQSRTRLQVKTNSYKLQFCLLFQGVQRAPGSEEPRELLSPEHRAMRKKSHCRQTSGIWLFPRKISHELGGKTKINPVTQSKKQMQDLGGGYIQPQNPLTFPNWWNKKIIMLLYTMSISQHYERKKV